MDGPKTFTSFVDSPARPQPLIRGTTDRRHRCPCRRRTRPAHPQFGPARRCRHRHRRGHCLRTSGGCRTGRRTTPGTSTSDRRRDPRRLRRHRLRPRRRPTPRDVARSRPADRPPARCSRSPDRRHGARDGTRPDHHRQSRVRRSAGSPTPGGFSPVAPVRAQRQPVAPTSRDAGERWEHVAMRSPQTLSECDRRLAAAWAADCAERVLWVFEAEAPHDRRPRDAIARARAFAEASWTSPRRFAGGSSVAALRVTCTLRAAIAAARAAGQAAAWPTWGARARCRRVRRQGGGPRRARSTRRHRRGDRMATEPHVRVGRGRAGTASSPRSEHLRPPRARAAGVRAAGHDHPWTPGRVAAPRRDLPPRRAAPEASAHDCAGWSRLVIPVKNGQILNTGNVETRVYTVDETPTVPRTSSACADSSLLCW